MHTQQWNEVYEEGYQSGYDDACAEHDTPRHLGWTEEDGWHWFSGEVWMAEINGRQVWKEELNGVVFVTGERMSYGGQPYDQANVDGTFWGPMKPPWRANE